MEPGKGSVHINPSTEMMTAMVVVITVAGRTILTKEAPTVEASNVQHRCKSLQPRQLPSIQHVPSAFRFCARNIIGVLLYIGIYNEFTWVHWVGNSEPTLLIVTSCLIIPCTLRENVFRLVVLAVNESLEPKALSSGRFDGAHRFGFPNAK